MADLAASDITVTVNNNRKLEDGRRSVMATLAFGDGAKTYPAGGVPITKGKLGCPNVIESLVVFDKGTSGYSWSYDAANEKLVAIQSPAHTHDLFLNNAEVADSAGARVNAGTDLLGANTGADVTVAGVTGVGGHGGVLQVPVASMIGAQPSAVAIAAQSLKVEVIGW